MKLAVLLVLFLALLGLDLAHALGDPSWLIVPAALLGWYLADFFSGAVHMVLDYRALPTGPRSPCSITTAVAAMATPICA